MTIKQISLVFVAIAATPISAMDRDYSGKKGPKPCPNNVRGSQQAFDFFNNGFVLNSGQLNHFGRFINLEGGVVINSGTWNSGNIPHPQPPQQAQPRNHSNIDLEIIEYQQRLKYPTKEELAYTKKRTNEQDLQINQLRMLDLTVGQKRQLDVLQTLTGLERITVGDSILLQYDKNTDIQKQIREHDQAFIRTAQAPQNQIPMLTAQDDTETFGEYWHSMGSGHKILLGISKQ